MGKTRELYDITMKLASDFIIDEYAESHGISKSFARKLFINALIYNTVVAEITGQMDFLGGMDDDKWEV